MIVGDGDVQLSEAKIARLRGEVLPLLWQARRQWRWLRWCLLALAAVAPLTAYQLVVNFVLTPHWPAWQDKDKYVVEAVLLPALTGISAKIWGQGGKLNCVSLAIQLGNFDLLVQSVQNLDFTFGKTSRLVEHVERILSQRD